MALMAVLGLEIRTWIALAVVIVSTTVALVLMRRIQRVVVRELEIRNYTADMIRRALMALIVVMAIFYVFDLLQLEIRPLVGGLGISGIIAAIALQPVIGNFIASMFLHSTRSFRPGDEIESNGITGTVVDISHRAVAIEDFDGNAVYIPNLQVLDGTLTNLTSDTHRRTVIPFQVAYDTDLRSTQERLRSALVQIEGVAERPAVEVLVRSFGESGINLEAQVWHPAEEHLAKRTVSESVIVIRETLAEIDVTIPFPQLVLQPRRES